MYRKFDVTENLLFAQYFFFEEINTAKAERPMHEASNEPQSVTA
jgi:hypothetical protein